MFWPRCWAAWAARPRSCSTGIGGLDELTTGGPNRVSHLRDGKVNTFDLDPVDPCLPFRRCSIEDLRGGDPGAERGNPPRRPGSAAIVARAARSSC